MNLVQETEKEKKKPSQNDTTGPTGVLTPKFDRKVEPEGFTTLMVTLGGKDRTFTNL